MCRPQYVGLFGQRGVGKTTLLTMLYREAVGGRLPDLRLAAADARTANYLSDKILQLEAGQVLPATLGETELRFHLYYQGWRQELVVRDYQGEQVALGRQEPIRDFLKCCDAVWLCLDAALATTPDERLHAQQEVEQLVEDYLAIDAQGDHRPMALIITKGDLLTPRERFLGSAVEPQALADLLDERFNMTRHAPAHPLLGTRSLRREQPRRSAHTGKEIGAYRPRGAARLAGEDSESSGRGAFATTLGRQRPRCALAAALRRLFHAPLPKRPGGDSLTPEVARLEPSSFPPSLSGGCRGSGVPGFWAGNV